MSGGVGEPAGRDPDVAAIAAEVLRAIYGVRQIGTFTGRPGGLTLAESYRVTAELHRLRLARGEKPVGRKIGFTNRTIWEEYGVYAPIWGYMYDTTVSEMSAGAELPAKRFTEPRIEPEICFGIAAPPSAGMSLEELLGCVGWVAHGFEIVQSIFPGWKFSAPDTVANDALHGAYVIGPRHPVAGRAEWLRELETFEVDLFRNGRLVDVGKAEYVLDGPLHALRHLVEVLAEDPVNPPLAAGEMVTTGTISRAFPVVAGEEWSTTLRGIPLEGARLRIV